MVNELTVEKHLINTTNTKEDTDGQKKVISELLVQWKMVCH